MSVQECEEMYTTKNDITQCCVQYGNVFLDITEIKRNVYNRE